MADRPDQTINVPGIDGPITFPGSMTDDQIQDAIRSDILPQAYKKAPEKVAQAQMTPTQQKAFQASGQAIATEKKQAAEKKAAEDKADPGFWKTMGRIGMGLAAMPAEAMAAYTHPVETYKTLPGRATQQFKERKQEAIGATVSAFTNPLVRQSPVTGKLEVRPLETLSRAGEGMGRSLAAITPGGPTAAEETATQFSKGHWGTGIAQLISLVGPSFLGMAWEARPSRGPRPTGAPIPRVQEEALGELRKEGVPLSLGQRTQDPYVMETERQMAGGSFGTPAGKIANEFYYGQREKLAEASARVASRVGPAAKSDAQSVRNLFGTLDTIIDQGSNEADRRYNALRHEAEQYKVPVKTGEVEVPGPRPEASLTPAGMPRKQAVYTVYEAPVSLANMADDVRAVYQNVLETLPEGQRAYSRGFQVLKQLNDAVEGGQVWMSAMTLDKTLSAVKGFLRDGKSELLTKSQGLAVRFIRTGEDQLAETFKDVSPGFMKRLQQARDVVREYHRVDELKSSLPTEPGQAFTQLTSRKDAYADRLRELEKLAPNQIRTIGRMYLEGWVGQAPDQLGRSVAMGGFTRSEGFFRALDDLGPETREILFGKQHSRELMKMALGAKLVAPAEGSATGRRRGVSEATREWLGKNGNTLAGGFINLIVTGTVVATGHGAAEALGVAGGLGALQYAERRYISPALRRRRARIWAEMSFYPDTPRLVNRALSSTVGSPAFRLAVEGLNSRAIMAAHRVDQEQAQPAAPTGGGSPRVAPPKAPAPRGGRGGVPAPIADQTKPKPAGAAAPSPLKPEIASLAARSSQRWEVPLDLLTQVLSRETGGETNPATAVSRKGAIGVGQIMPKTGAELGLTEADLRDPAKNVDATARYLRQLLDKYHWDRKLAMAAYNAGPGAVDTYGRVPPYSETQKYVQGMR